MMCRVRGLVLRGVCLMRPEEIDWMYGGDAAAVQVQSHIQSFGLQVEYPTSNEIVHSPATDWCSLLRDLPALEIF